MALQVPQTQRILVYKGTAEALLAKDIYEQVHFDILRALRGIPVEVTRQQIALGNPPNLINVDNVRGKSVEEATRRVQVWYGDTIDASILDTVRQALMNSIRIRTRRKSGALSSAGNWTWLHVHGRRAVPPLAQDGKIRFYPNDALVLRPTGVPHSTVANQAVAGPSRSKKQKKVERKALKGFLGMTTAKLKRQLASKGLKITVRTTSKHTVQGERSKYGTQYIALTADAGRRRRSR